MKTRKPLLLLLSFFFLLSRTQAQKEFVTGYIIRSSNDTARGTIDDQNWDVNPKKITFKSDNGKIESLGYRDIKEFCIQGRVTEVYRTKVLDLDKGPYEVKDLLSYPMPQIFRDTVFATLYESGTINLYFLKDETSRYHYIVEKNDTGIQDMGIQRYIDDTKIKSTDIYKNQLNKLMADCPGVIMKLGDLPYGEKEIRSLVSYYNNYVMPAKPTETKTHYSQNKEKVQVAFGIIAGAGFRKDKLRQSLDYHPLTGLSLGPSPNVDAGIWFSIVLPRTKRALEICSEFEWNYFDQKKKFTFGTSSDVNTVEIAAHIVRGDVLFRYSLPTGQVKPVFSLGGSLGSAVAYTNTFNTNQEAIPFVQFQWAVIAGAGITVKNLGVELRYFLGSSISHRFIVLSTPHSLNLTFRYGFPLTKDKPVK
ncbi:MAG: PorT family protein [Bacteroidetes bacterium]|nr:PorT family protein [Bacteroidota bacterium]